MAQPRTPKRAATSGKSIVKAGKTYPRSSLRTTNTKSMAESSSDEDSNDEANDDDDDDGSDEEEQEAEDEDEEEEQSDSEPDAHALSSAYPFEFGNDGSLTGTDDEMEMDLIRPTSKEGREFEKSMALADAHVMQGVQEVVDDDYDGVNAISDDDEELAEEDSEVDVLREAEKDLIAEYEQTEFRREPIVMDTLAGADMDQLDDSRRYSMDSEDPFTLPNFNMNEDPFQGAAFMDETWGSLWETAELGIWRKPGADNEMPAARSARQKRVRFQDSSSALVRVPSQSSSESSEDDEDEQQFPDIFMDQADPKIQQLLAHDSETEWNGLSTNGSDVESVYDFEDDADRVAFELDEDSDSSNADVSSECKYCIPLLSSLVLT